MLARQILNCAARVILLAVITGTCSAHADAPTTQPSTATLFGGRIEFTPPSNWSVAHGNVASNMIAFYLADDHDGYFAIQVLPSNASIDPQAIPKMIAQLIANHKKAKQEIVEAPKAGKDERFTIMIHERYKNAEGKTADELHLYRQVSGRAVELDIQSLSDDSDRLKAIHRIGQETLASAHWVKPDAKKK